MPSLLRTARLVLTLTLAVAATAAADGLRVVTWNVSNYAGGRAAAFETAVYGEFDGRSMAPDVVLLQEMLTATAVQQLVQILNAAPDSPGDWAAAPFVDGNDTDNGFLYRASKVELLGSVVVAQGGASPNHPRDINRYDVRLVGYGSNEGVISLYSSHMKASTGGSNEARRLLEAQRIRADAEALPDGQHFILGGDFNIRSSNEGAYQELIIARDDGRFVDPIASPGSWNNSSTFRYIHTQDPIGAGGVDDRYDQLLVSESLVDGDGADYVGQATIPYSRSTWDDPNHSYRCWGNDGSSYNTVLRSEGNEMVGADIADALKLICNGSGHLPVLLDLVVPARLGADAVVDFGTVTVGASATEMLAAGNAGDTVLWGPGGVGVLEYALGVDAPVWSAGRCPVWQRGRPVQCARDHARHPDAGCVRGDAGDRVERPRGAALRGAGARRGGGVCLGLERGRERGHARLPGVPQRLGGGGSHRRSDRRRRGRYAGLPGVPERVGGGLLSRRG
ncbi:MAG: hypothetical protein HND58_14990 [Planctomycetota bacterium]|nr:MAG: hypothetical protein HND58_14990 [Planctomycetota bacterium]